MKKYQVTLPTQASLLEDIFVPVEVNQDPFDIKPELEDGSVTFDDGELAHRFALTTFGISVGGDFNIKIPHEHHQGYNECYKLYRVKLPLRTKIIDEGIEEIEAKGFQGIFDLQREGGFLFQSRDLAFQFALQYSLLKDAFYAEEGDFGIFETSADFDLIELVKKNYSANMFAKCAKQLFGDNWEQEGAKILEKQGDKELINRFFDQCYCQTTKQKT